MGKKGRVKKGGAGIALAFLALFSILCFSVSATEKPVEGYVFEGARPLADATIKVYMTFKESGDGGKEIICLTYPTVSTDSRGYFITNLGNLRVLGNNYPCEDRWRKGDVLAVIAKGFFTTLPDGENPAVPSESGAALTLKGLAVTDRKFEPLYSELSLAKLKMTSLGHAFVKGSKKVVFDAEAYNPNNVALEDVFLKVVITKKDDRNDIVGNVEERFGIDAFEKKQVQMSWDFSGVGYGNYLYNAVLYTATTTHDRILDRELSIMPLLGLLTLQNALILVMAVVIITLIMMLIRSKRKGQKGRLKRKS